MADIPVIQIEIDDAQYRAFEERVKQFRAEESEAPGAWEGTAEQIEVIKRRFEEMSRAAGSGAAAARDTEASAKSTIGTFSDGAAIAWDLMRPLVRGTARTIAGATRDLARWERAAAVVGGLLGAGSLIGLDALAEKAAARRRQATGVGVSTGELAAFQTNFGRLGDTSSLLRGFNTAATDQLARQPLQSLGVDARGKNATQLFAETLPRVKELVDRIDPKMMGPTLIDSYHLDRLGFSEETLRLIRRMKRSEIQDMLSGAHRDAPGFDIPDDIGRKWTDLVNQLTVAGNRIETSLAGSLVNIAPGVTHVSESLVRLTDALLSQPEFTKWLGETADGVEKLAGWIGSSESQKALRHAVDQFKMSRDDVRRLEDWLGSHAGTLRALGGAAAGAAAGGMIGGVPGAIIGGAVGAGAGYIAHDDNPGGIDRLRQGVIAKRDADRMRQRQGGAKDAEHDASEQRHNAAYDVWKEQHNLDQYNAQRKAYGDKPLTQEEYDKADPPPRSAPASVSTPNRPGSITPENHPVRYEGNLKIDDQTFHFASGGNHGAYSSPPGDQTIESFTPPGVRQQHPFNAGYFRIAPKYDPELGRTREGVLIHESSHGMNVHEVVSSGCFAVPRSEWPQLEETLRNKLAKLGGRAVLRVGSDGNAEVVPMGTPPVDGKVGRRTASADYSPVPAQRPALAPAGGTTPAKLLAAHPNNRPPPAPAVHVTDNTGGATQVTVH